MADYCSKCHKVWTLTERNGTCQWCGKLATADHRTGHTNRFIKSRWHTLPTPDDHAEDYRQLEGKWAFFYQVAALYSKRVPTEDREDTLHDIMLELEHAQSRDGKPLPELRAYRIASLMIALYWRTHSPRERLVCVYSGIAKKLHCQGCTVKAGQPCAYRAIRPILYLEDEITDDQGYMTSLKELVADDQAIDLDQWQEASLFLNQCPVRLIEIAHKKQAGKRLSENEQKYLWRFRAKQQKKLF